jgi:uncharacterized protein (UPF0332 family)
MAQARESLQEARALLAEGMDMGFIMNNLYYALFYPVLAVLNEGQVPTSMQSVTIALFDKEFIQTGVFEKRFVDALRRAFDLRPKCSVAPSEVSREEAERLAALAEEFISRVEKYLQNGK